MPAIHTADEKTMLTGMLDWYRTGIVSKTVGLGAEQASRVIVPSGTSIIGIINHLALVEDSWFEARFAGRDLPAPFNTVDWDSDPDWEFRTARQERLRDVVARYEAACERSRSTVSRGNLDDEGAAIARRFTLRFVLVHLIEETARHLGHVDVMRELIDGAVGE